MSTDGKINAIEASGGSNSGLPVAPVTVLDIVGGDSSPPTWTLTFKRVQKLCITFFAMQAFIKMYEGKADDAKGQADRMELMVDKLVADWVEAKGLVVIQNVENIADLQPYFKQMLKTTTAGPVCVVNYSQYNNKKQSKYSGAKLLAFAREARKLIHRDAYPKWLELCDKTAAAKAGNATPRSGLNFDQLLEEVRQSAWTASKKETEAGEAEDVGSDDGESAGSGEVPAQFKPSWWFPFQLLGPWGSRAA
jgi:hypothetical protein